MNNKKLFLVLTVLAAMAAAAIQVFADIGLTGKIVPKGNFPVVGSTNVDFSGGIAAGGSTNYTIQGVNPYGRRGTNGYSGFQRGRDISHDSLTNSLSDLYRTEFGGEYLEHFMETAAWSNRPVVVVVSGPSTITANAGLLQGSNTFVLCLSNALYFRGLTNSVFYDEGHSGKTTADWFTNAAGGPTGYLVSTDAGLVPDLYVICGWGNNDKDVLSMTAAVSENCLTNGLIWLRTNSPANNITNCSVLLMTPASMSSTATSQNETQMESVHDGYLRASRLAGVSAAFIDGYELINDAWAGGTNVSWMDRGSLPYPGTPSAHVHPSDMANVRLASAVARFVIPDGLLMNPPTQTGPISASGPVTSTGQISSAGSAVAAQGTSPGTLLGSMALLVWDGVEAIMDGYGYGGGGPKPSWVRGSYAAMVARTGSGANTGMLAVSNNYTAGVNGSFSAATNISAPGVTGNAFTNAAGTGIQIDGVGNINIGVMSSNTLTVLNGGGSVILSSGATNNGAAWVATQKSAVIINMINSGQGMQIAWNTNLTNGVIFTPTAVGQFNNSGWTGPTTGIHSGQIQSPLGYITNLVVGPGGTVAQNLNLVSGGLNVQGNAVYTNTTGWEIEWTGTTAYLSAVNRAGSGQLPIIVRGSNVNLTPNNNAGLDVGTTGSTNATVLYAQTNLVVQGVLQEAAGYAPKTVNVGTNYLTTTADHIVAINSATNCTLTLAASTNEIRAILYGGGTNLTVSVSGNGWFFGSGTSAATVTLAATNLYIFNALDLTKTNFGFK